MRNNPPERGSVAPNSAMAGVDELLVEAAPAVIKKLIRSAAGGNLSAMRMYLDRLLPPGRRTGFALPTLSSAADATAALAAIARAVEMGDLTPADAGGLARLVEAFVKVKEASEFETRLQALEQRWETQR